MGKTENPSSLLETMEENKNKIPNAKSIGYGTLDGEELACSRKGYWRMAQVLNQIFSKKIIARLGYTSMSDYYLTVCEN